MCGEVCACMRAYVCVCVCLWVGGWTYTTNPCTFPPHLAGHTISAANGREKKNGLNAQYKLFSQ